MTPEPKLQTATGADSLEDLLLRREQVQGWLARLDEFSGDVPPHVAERVRADYEGRLRDTVAALSEHLSGLEAELERLQSELIAGGSRYEQAVDRLEEVRLRHRIGEMDAAEWAAQRVGLESAVQSAGAEREEVSAELQRMEQLVEQIQSSDAAPAADAWLPILTHHDAAAGAPPTPVTEPSISERTAAEPFAEEPAAAEEDALVSDADQDLAFLEELDRALTTAGDESVELQGAPESDGRPKAGVRCPECGYTNDSTAWYCGVCGVDLA